MPEFNQECNRATLVPPAPIVLPDYPAEPTVQAAQAEGMEAEEAKPLVVVV
jgi:hypothetical protein